MRLENKVAIVTGAGSGFGAAIVTPRSMAAEPGRDNIRVNVVNPVIGETGLLETFMGMPDTPENRARFIATIPMGRLSLGRCV